MVTYPSKKRYDARTIIKVTVGFNRNTEPELVERIEQEPNRTAFIKELVRERVEAEKGQK